jgi:cysteine desulfurase
MSTNRRIYLDFNATAPLVPAAREAVTEAMRHTGNPSSIHAEGRGMRDRVERARNQVAALVGRPREQIVFTSGGTEANWLGVMALAAAAEARGLPRIIATTPIEHPSLRGAIAALVPRGWQVAHLPASLDHGVIEVGQTPRAGVVAVGLVNHELGTILGDDIVRWARESGSLVHLDAVQAAGKLPLASLDADSMAISGHKIGGPQGIGALALAVDQGLPLVEGGHQERGRRPGTENVLGIIGFGAAAASDLSWAAAATNGRELEGMLVQQIERVRIHGMQARRVGTTINARFEGARGESIVMGLDLEGISVSTGAACTSGSVQPSAVLLGLGLTEDQAREAVRFSLGPTTTFDELVEVMRVLPGIVERARRHR